VTVCRAAQPDAATTSRIDALLDRFHDVTRMLRS
jgi:hypothetical protein